MTAALLAPYLSISNGSSSGHLINVDAGPSTSSGIGVDLLDTPTVAQNLLDINAVDTGSNGPELINAGLLTGGANDTGLPVLGGLTGTTGDLLTINGGNNANDGGIVGGTVGDLAGSSTGHLIDADAGQPTSNGTGIDLLDVPTPASNVLNVTGVDVGPNGPHLLDLGVLTGTNGLNIPSLNGAGTDSLTGNILSGGTASAPAAGTAPTPPSPTLRTSTAYCRDRSRATTASSDVAGHHII